ncbi:MAG: zinc ribbon domain-containing protein [Syntrophaceae bacterium]|nr:zinc ribbon domain-containing protein [Syntrophaceae bacterium]
MPIREYSCEDCGAVSELLVGIGRNSSEVVCKSCGSSRLKVMMSAPSISVNQGTSESASFGSCCGSNPSSAGCAGPGSCCGANR